MNRWQRARRDLLRQLGAGAALLPLLRAGRALSAPASKSLIIAVMPHGYEQAAWRPRPGRLAGQTLPSSSSPLEPHKEDVIFLPGLTNPSVCARCGEEAYGTLFWGAAGAPTSTLPNYPEPAGRTLDQEVAAGLPMAGRRTLAQGAQIDNKQMDPPSGYNRCFWTGPGMPVPIEADPWKTYADLFAGPQPSVDGEVMRLFRERRSMLDYVGKSLERFGKRVGTEDRRAIEAHTQAIRDVEKELVMPVGPMPGPASCGGQPGPMVDLLDDASYPKILEAQIDLALAALRCGATRVATLQLGNTSAWNVNFSAFLPGIPPKGTGFKTAFRNWHDIAHNPLLGGVNHKVVVDKWAMEVLADILAKMKTIPALGGSLLESSAVLWATTHENGGNHNAQAVPWILAGKAGGTLDTGQCAASDGKPLRGVLAEICSAMGLAGEPFGPGIGGIRKA
jgi:hypothetical protein